MGVYCRAHRDNKSPEDECPVCLKARVAVLEAENAELKQWLEEARGNTSAWSSPPNY